MMHVPLTVAALWLGLAPLSGFGQTCQTTKETSPCCSSATSSKIVPGTQIAVATSAPQGAQTSAERAELLAQLEKLRAENEKLRERLQTRQAFPLLPESSDAALMTRQQLQLDRARANQLRQEAAEHRRKADQERAQADQVRARAGRERQRADRLRSRAELMRQAAQAQHASLRAGKQARVLSVQGEEGTQFLFSESPFPEQPQIQVRVETQNAPPCQGSCSAGSSCDGDSPCECPHGCKAPGETQGFPLRVLMGLVGGKDMEGLQEFEDESLENLGESLEESIEWLTAVSGEDLEDHLSELVERLEDLGQGEGVDFEAILGELGGAGQGFLGALLSEEELSDSIAETFEDLGGHFEFRFEHGDDMLDGAMLLDRSEDFDGAYLAIEDSNGESNGDDSTEGEEFEWILDGPETEESDTDGFEFYVVPADTTPGLASPATRACDCSCTDCQGGQCPANQVPTPEPIFVVDDAAIQPFGALFSTTPSPAIAPEAAQSQGSTADACGVRIYAHGGVVIVHNGGPEACASSCSGPCETPCKDSDDSCGSSCAPSKSECSGCDSTAPACPDACEDPKQARFPEPPPPPHSPDSVSMLPPVSASVLAMFPDAAHFAKLRTSGTHASQELKAQTLEEVRALLEEMHQEVEALRANLDAVRSAVQEARSQPARKRFPDRSRGK